MKTQNVKFNAVVEIIEENNIGCIVHVEDESFNEDYFFNVDTNKDFSEIFVYNEDDRLDADTKADFDTEGFKTAFVEAIKKIENIDKIEIDEFSFTAEIELAD